MSFEVIAACLLASLTPAHPLPDNHIERGVQVYVYPERIEVHYHLGLTDRQVAVELAELDPEESVPDDPAEALRRYEQLVAPQLAEQLQLAVDGEVRSLTVGGIDRRERRHERFVVQCESAVRIGPEPRRIELSDMTLPGVAALECRRMALRGKHEVVVDKCSGQPTLIRVPREPAPARLYRPHEPSRTIVAICRIPTETDEAEEAAPGGSDVMANNAATVPSPETTKEAEGVATARSLRESRGALPTEGAANQQGTWLVPPAVALALVAAGLALFAVRFWLRVRPDGKSES